MLRTGSSDTDIFEEIYGRMIYDPPAAVTAALAGSTTVRVADLGANIGLFALRAFESWRAGQVTSFEPDPANLQVLLACRAGSPHRSQWTVYPVAAGNENRTIPFLTGRLAVSRSALAYELAHEDRSDVEMVDVLPLLASVEMIKLDIEGGEWPILTDPRFAGLRARAIALEYHPEQCPERDPRRAAMTLLERAGYELAEACPPLDGVGQLWGWRSVRSRPEAHRSSSADRRLQ